MLFKWQFLSKVAVVYQPPLRSKLVAHVCISQRCRFSSVPPNVLKETKIEDIRNIGIMAHIDAGKTTTTERMLYFSGFTRHLGDVDRGDTVTDYMEQERERGITIQSAAVTFNWNKHQINLIDTPGHVDFTAEVERCLRVLDGSVAVLDASAGVEAQTITVWRQADKFNIPRLIFLNKMDKHGANFNMCMQSIKQKLNVTPIPVNLPIGADKTFCGVVDLLTLEQLTWDSSSSKNGLLFNVDKLDQPGSGSVNETVLQARANMIGQLADLDDTIAEYVLSDTKLEDIPVSDLRQALRRATISGKAVPVLSGSSKRNIAVQPLMDAVVSYLPSPVDIEYDFIKYYQKELCALAFKTVHDKHRGALTFVRLYSGTLKGGKSVYNANMKITEKLSTADIYQVNADEYKTMKAVTAGNIVCIAGLEHTRTGDTLITSGDVGRQVARRYRQAQVGQGTGVDPDDADEDEGATLAGIEIPAPVFFCSIEAPSSAKQKEMEEALERLQREDPSLKVESNEDTGQTILSGMGELHLDIIKNRLKTEYKLDVYFGPLQISYRENLSAPIEHRLTVERVIGKQNNLVTMAMRLVPGEVNAVPSKRNTVIDQDKLPLKHYQRNAVEQGVLTALTYGPLYHAPVMNVQVHVTELTIGPGTTQPFLRAAVCQGVREALASGECYLAEPVMSLQITTDESHVSAIRNNIIQRRGDVMSSELHNTLYVLSAFCPLAELVGYATDLRILTSGAASFSMELAHYQRLLPQEQDNVLNNRYAF